MPEINTSIVVVATPERVLDAFFDHDALAAWWGIRRFVCMKRPLGTYAVEWDPTEWRDKVLGHLGGGLHGTVFEYKPGRELFLADAWWVPPEGEPIGPTAIEITCNRDPWGTKVRVRHSGQAEGPRWDRYLEIMRTGWEGALASLQTWFESRHTSTATSRNT